MGRLILPDGGPSYVDSNSSIYWFEKIEPFASASAPLWEALQDQKMLVVTSALSLLEVLVKPLREGDEFLINLYRKVFLNTRGFESLNINEEILSLAAQVRADWRLKTPDAIHAATAIHTGATMFLTNDTIFRRVPGLNVVLLGDLIAP